MKILPTDFLSSLSDYDKNYDGNAETDIAWAISVVDQCGLSADSISNIDENGTPLVGATVFLVFAGDAVVATIMTDSTGKSTCNNVVHEDMTFSWDQPTWISEGCER